MLVCFIAPAFTAGAISLEREKQTLDLLVSTPMRPGGDRHRQARSALAFVVLMILAGIPVSALVLMYGGASVEDILRQQVVLFAVGHRLRRDRPLLLRAHQAHPGRHGADLLTVLALTLGTVCICVLLDGRRQPVRPSGFIGRPATGARGAALPEPGDRDGRDRGRYRSRPATWARSWPSIRGTAIQCAETSASRRSRSTAARGRPVAGSRRSPTARRTRGAAADQSSVVDRRRQPATCWPRYRAHLRWPSLSC